MELVYIPVDASSLRGSGIHARSGRHVLRGNLKSGCESLTIAGVSNFAKRVLRFVLAAFERPQHQTDTPSILQEVISTVPSAEPMAIISNMGRYAAKETFEVCPSRVSVTVFEM